MPLTIKNAKLISSNRIDLHTSVPLTSSHLPLYEENYRHSSDEGWGEGKHFFAVSPREMNKKQPPTSMFIHLMSLHGIHTHTPFIHSVFLPVLFRSLFQPWRVSRFFFRPAMVSESTHGGIKKIALCGSYGGCVNGKVFSGPCCYFN
jgi:hypothetical protein